MFIRPDLTSDHYSGVRPVLSPPGAPQAAGPVSDAGQPADPLLSRRGELQVGLLEQGRGGDQEQLQEPGGRPGLQSGQEWEQQGLAEPHHQKYRHVSIYLTSISPPCQVLSKTSDSARNVYIDIS